MAKIKIICGGCGINYTDEHGNARHTLKTPESGPFECDDAQAARLVNLGVAAVYVEGIGWQKVGDTVSFADAQQAETVEPSQETEQETEATTGHLDEKELAKMDYNELKALAAEMGVTVSGKKKSDYIAAIATAEVEVDDEDDGNDLPELTAADPE